ncbi:hypothetical protein [Corallococcus sp. CA053C]|uniref:hypothetical protein n=1 Tax=Corallococcus sp. CA053C TaxID=2316732 RepID=UPI0011C49F1F|nr:hypothetical protein [Corallococcus sp. CA053C]
MTSPDLLQQVKKAIASSGYPLEQRVAHALQKHGWHTFHSVTYYNNALKSERELDILAYKLINERRIELRISCKRSASKPWIFFTEDASRYFKHASTLKTFPVSDSPERYKALLGALKGLLFFSHGRSAINFAAFGGKDMAENARTIVRDGLMSALSSIYERLHPHRLLADERGVVVFLLTVFDGNMFESYYDPAIDEDAVKPIDYAQWDTRHEVDIEGRTVPTPNGGTVPIGSVLYWLGNIFRIEVVRWPFFMNYIGQLESTFGKLSPDEVRLLGKPWSPANFPKTVGPMPTFTVSNKYQDRDGVGE